MAPKRNGKITQNKQRRKHIRKKSVASAQLREKNRLRMQKIRAQERKNAPKAPALSPHQLREKNRLRMQQQRSTW